MLAEIFQAKAPDTRELPTEYEMPQVVPTESHEIGRGRKEEEATITGLWERLKKGDIPGEKKPEPREYHC